MKHIIFLLVFLTGPLFAADHVGVGIPPIAYLVERIGGDQISPIIALGEGQNPHSFTLSPRKVSKLAQSKLYLSIDFLFEHKVERTIRSVGKAKIVNVARGVHFIKQEHDDHHDHHDHHRDHGNDKDQHIWTSPKNLKVIAFNIYKTLKENYPSKSKSFSENYKKLKRELDTLESDIDKLLSPLANKTILIYHPSINYLTDPYKIITLPIEYEGKKPTPKQLNEVITLSKKHGTKAVLIAAQFNTQTIQPIAQAIGGKPVTYEILSYNIIDGLRKVASTVAKSVGTK